MHRRPVSILVAVAALVATTGCSLIAVKGPPATPPPAPEPLVCTDSRVAPWVDTYVAAVAGAIAIGVSLKPCSHEDFGCLGQVLILLPTVPMSVGYGISALWGHHAVTGCRAMRASSRGDAGGPPGGAPAPAPPPPGLAGPVTGVVKGPGPTDVHTAPSDVSPVLMQLPPGQTISLTGAAGESAWRAATLPGGRIGYVRNDGIRREAVATPATPAPAAPATPPPVTPTPPLTPAQ